ncbi:hypothetical protein MHYP_G00351730 [Metynnis hypsauchen]
MQEEQASIVWSCFTSVDDCVTDRGGGQLLVSLAAKLNALITDTSLRRRLVASGRERFALRSDRGSHRKDVSAAHRIALRCLRVGQEQVLLPSWYFPTALN